MWKRDLDQLVFDLNGSRLMKDDFMNTVWGASPDRRGIFALAGGSHQGLIGRTSRFSPVHFTERKRGELSEFMC